MNERSQIDDLLTKRLDGELRPEEERALERLLERHPDAGAEGRAFERIAGAYAALEPPAPAPALKQNILAAIRADSKPAPAPVVVNVEGRYAPGFGLAAAAIVLVTLGGIFWPAEGIALELDFATWGAALYSGAIEAIQNLGPALQEQYAAVVQEASALEGYVAMLPSLTVILGVLAAATACWFVANQYFVKTIDGLLPAAKRES